MSVDRETLTRLYFQNDMPCPYDLKCGYTLYISPIKLKDWGAFAEYINILDIKKNRIDDINIIKMSYLEFLFHLISENKNYSEAFANVLFYSLGEEHCFFTTDKNNRIVLCLCDSDKNIKGFITSKEFDDIKLIILYQNLVNYDDRYVDPDVEQLKEDYYRIKYRNSKTPSLEEQKTYVIAKTGLTMEKLNDMTYRTFSQVYDHAIGDFLYIGHKIIQGSYKYKVDKDIVHPLYEKKRDEYEEIFTSGETLAQKGISGTEKLNGIM